MAAVLEPKNDPAAKFGSQVEEQLAQTTSRIRAHDLTLGGLTLAAMVAVYTTSAILLDRYLNLPEWVRQLSLAAFLAAFGTVGYLLIIRPLRRRINPLYAAAKVEQTIDDAKNSVTGYVEAQERGGVHGAVKAAMSAKAAEAVGVADVNRAVDHRSLLVAGGVLVAFLLALGVLFFVFRPTQFTSLVGRAFVPFSSDPIASRTQLTLVKPDPADPTITIGQSVNIAVTVGGRVPAKTSPERVRVLIRHNPTDPNYEILPMEEGETSREWQVKVPGELVQNGFWYKVAAGDAETPEHRVTVRSLPLFDGFETAFVYPAYTRRDPGTGRDANIQVYRGTKVTLVAKTNRDAVTGGQLKFEAAGLAPVTGKPVPGRPDSLQFQFTATEATHYRLYFTTATEKNTDPPRYVVAIDSDQPPTGQITKPEAKPDEPELTAPANGQLAVDAVFGDDFGIDKVRLRLRVEGRMLAPIPYPAGKDPKTGEVRLSFRRDKDGTWPKNLEPKMSADLPKLTYADGTRFVPREGMVIEFWVEAIDNCTEAKPVEDWDKQVGNVGRSETRRLRLTAPKTTDEDKQQLDQQKNQRNNEEQQHNQQQQQKLDAENRDKKDQPQNGQPEAKKDQPPEAKPGGEPNPPKKPDDNMGGTDMGNPMPKTGDPKPDPKNQPQPKGKDGTGGMGGDPKSDPKMPPDGKNPDMPPMADPNGMGGMGAGGMAQAPPPKTPEDKAVEEQKNQLQKELDKNKGQGGDAKPNPNANANPEDRTDPAQPKPQPMDGAAEDSKPKDGPKPQNPNDPMPKGGTRGGAAESKPEGKLEPPTDPDSQPKPEPKTGANTDPKQPKNNQLAESRDEPLGGAAGHEKPEPKAGDKQPDPKEPKNPNADPKSGATGKPAAPPKDGEQPGKPTAGGTEDPKTPKDPQKNPAPNAGQMKPKSEPDRGRDKDPAQPKGGPPSGEEKPKDDGAAGDAKPQKAPDAAGTKPAPKKDDMMGSGAGMSPDASDPKPPPKETPDPKNPNAPKGGAAEDKPEPKTPPMGGGAGVLKGEDKPEPADPKGQPGGGKDDKKADGKAVEDAVKDLKGGDPKKEQDAKDKLDKAVGEQARKEAEQIAKDLQSPDKDTRDAAQKKLEDLKKKADELAKKDEGKGEPGKKLTPEEITELAKKAADLNSDDPAKRKAAEDLFDEKLGEEKRKEIQEQLKKQPPPKDPKGDEDLKKQIEEAAKNPGKGKGPVEPKNDRGPGASTDPLAPPAEEDPRNRAKTAELQLEEFEKNRYNKALQEKLGWTQREMDEFLEAYRKRVEQYQKEAEEFERRQRENPPTPTPTGDPTIKLDSGGKIETRPNGSAATGAVGGATVAPPGFEGAREKFQKLLPKK